LLNGFDFFSDRDVNRNLMGEVMSIGSVIKIKLILLEYLILFVDLHNGLRNGGLPSVVDHLKY
jgi:hypothetical protein